MIIVAATPIDPPEGDLCWRFHLVNDSSEPLEWVVLESVDYEWGDVGHGKLLGLRFGPIGPGKSVELLKETDTEVRTSVTLRVRDSSGERQVLAEFGKLYRQPGRLDSIPILNIPGKVASLDVRPLPRSTLEIDEAGVRRRLSDGRIESVRWDALVKVEVTTTEAGPAVDDIFFLLHASDGNGCVVPSEAPGSDALLTRLQKLPGFDNEAFIRAMASTRDARFVVWEAGRW